MKNILSKMAAPSYYRQGVAALIIGGMTALSSCSKEYLNPSAATETNIINDVNGLIALCNGLQYKFTVTRVSPGYAATSANGLTTGELIILNAGNADEDFLRQGAANVQGNNSLVNNIWTQCNLTKSNADIILKNAESVKDAGTKSGLIAYASIFRAMAIATMAQYFQQVTVQVGSNAPVVPREDALKEAVRTLESAAQVLATTPPSATFTGRIVTGIDLPNTIQALIARYALVVGDYDKAIAAADRVSLTVRSFYAFDDVTRNAMFESVFSNRNVSEPAANFGLPAVLPAAATDRRRAFYYNPAPSATINLGRAGFYTANSSAVPVYLPGETLLIRAEAQARKNNLTAAVADLNRVLTKTTDAWGIGAALPAYAGENTQAAILTEIYRNRCIELFMSGMKLEDSRRFSRPAPGTAGAERSRNFYPYPLTERDNNPVVKALADPTI